MAVTWMRSRWHSDAPTATLVGTAIVEGYELMFKGSRTGSYATIEPKEGSIVPVLVWEIGQMDERRLDYYEGYPNFYYKKMLEVQINGENETCDGIYHG